MDQERLSIIYSGNIVQADVLKCLLEGQGIEAFLQDKAVGTIAPLVHRRRRRCRQGPRGE
jgi:hypothetical protein